MENDGDVRMVPKLKNRTVLILLLVAKLCESLPILGDFKAKLHFPQSHFPFQSFIYFFYFIFTHQLLVTPHALKMKFGN